MGGAVSKVDSVVGEFGGGGNAVALEEGSVDEVAVTAGVDEELGGATLDEASENEKVGSGGMEMEVDGKGEGFGGQRRWQRRRRRRRSSCRCWRCIVIQPNTAREGDRERWRNGDETCSAVGSVVCGPFRCKLCW